MILVTGDTHGKVDFDKIKTINEKGILSQDDYLIIAGDFGAILDPNTLNQDLAIYNDLPFTVLFVDGNHENFALLNSYPVSMWNGGKVHVIKDNIIHLMRGQVYLIEGKTIFTFGGATSVDQYRRIENISWWKEEMPTIEEFIEAKENLLKYNNQVDYIITHTCDAITIRNYLIFFRGKVSEIFMDNEMLDYFETNVQYKHWYFGHYHFDGKITENKTGVYNSFYELK